MDAFAAHNVIQNTLSLLGESKANEEIIRVLDVNYVLGLLGNLVLLLHLDVEKGECSPNAVSPVVPDIDPMEVRLIFDMTFLTPKTLLRAIKKVYSV
jgi:hypothetical protein